MHLPSAILACATCMVDKDTNTAQAAGTAIFFMVGVVGVVLSILLYVIISFARKQSRYAKSHPEFSS